MKHSTAELTDTPHPFSRSLQNPINNRCTVTVPSLFILRPALTKAPFSLLWRVGLFLFSISHINASLSYKPKDPVLSLFLQIIVELSFFSPFAAVLTLLVVKTRQPVTGSWVLSLLQLVNSICLEHYQILHTKLIMQDRQSDIPLKGPSETSSLTLFHL